MPEHTEPTPLPGWSLLQPDQEQERKLRRSHWQRLIEQEARRAAASPLPSCFPIITDVS